MFRQHSQLLPPFLLADGLVDVIENLLSDVHSAVDRAVLVSVWLGVVEDLAEEEGVAGDALHWVRSLDREGWEGEEERGLLGDRR